MSVNCDSVEVSDVSEGDIHGEIDEEVGNQFEKNSFTKWFILYFYKLSICKNAHYSYLSSNYLIIRIRFMN